MTVSIVRRLALRLPAAAALVLAAALPFAASASAASPAWRIAAVSGPTNLAPLSSEIQELSVNSSGGELTLGFEGQTTDPIPFDAAPARLADALEALPAIGAGGVEVSGGPGGAGATSPYFVRFSGSLATIDVPALVPDPAGLSGAASTATVETETEGGEPGEGTIAIFAENVGAAVAGGSLLPTELVDLLPGGLVPTAASGSGWSCSVVAQRVSCTSAEAVNPGLALGTVAISVRVQSAAAELPNRVTVSGGGAAVPATYEAPITVSAGRARAGIQAFQAGAYDEDGAPDTRAGAHPFQASTAFFLNTVLSPAGDVVPAGDPREVEVDLPPGFVGNPLAAPRCPGEGQTGCGEAAQVGFVALLIQSFTGDSRGGQSIYNDTPAYGYPAEFTFNAIAITPRLFAELRSDGDYGVTVSSINTPQFYTTFGAIVTLCSYGSGGGIATSTGCREKGAPAANPEPLLTNPADCAEQAARPPRTELRTNTWQESARFDAATVVLPAVSGCASLSGHFTPAFSFQPESHRAASPSAFSAHLELPQDGLEEPDGLAAPPLRRAVVKLPAGVAVNPASATGLEACSESQIGLITSEGAAPNRIRFDKSPPSCPEASKLGTVEAESPLLEGQLRGSIYLAAQEANPFGSLLALYLVLEDPRHGILVKLPGEVEPDPASGQLTATFDDNPQLPVSSLSLRFRGGGPRSPLATPDVCGSYSTSGEWTPWSAPESGPPTRTRSEFPIDEAAGGGACPASAAARPFAPSFEAGTTSTAAGAYSPLTIRVSRADGEQELRRLRFTLPAGLSGRLAGIPYCPEAAIAAARARGGRAELAAPSCPAGSQIGRVDTAAGIGSEPIHVGGRVYLAGPYEGAPVSAVVVTPAVAGPFDLGNVVVRAPLSVDPVTAQITAASDPIPAELRGVPVSLRAVSIEVDRSAFTLNPTSCEAASVRASLEGGSGTTATPSSRFQVGGCAGLGFSPKLKLSLRGPTRRSGFPALKAVLTQPGGQADVRYARVLLPRSAFLEQGHIRTVCSRPQFAASPRACPAGSVYGWAKAWTPLLGAPIEGPVYLRSNGGERELPDLVAALRGPDSQPVEIDLLGYVDAVHARLRTTFALVPDAPVSRFVLEMRGGRRGLLVNSANLCRSARRARRATVRLVGHNNRRADQFPVVAAGCHRAKGRHGRHHR
jgi:hypothetical protein